MRLVYVVSILLALMTSAQCQQTQEESCLKVKEEMGPYSMSFCTSMIDKVKQLPEEKSQTGSGFGYTSYKLELYNRSDVNLGYIIINKFAGKLAPKGSDTRDNELRTVLRDQGCTKITSQEIDVDGRNALLVVCESNDVFVFEYRISSSDLVLGLISLPWNTNTKNLLDTLHVKKSD